MLALLAVGCSEPARDEAAPRPGPTVTVTATTTITPSPSPVTMETVAKLGETVTTEVGNTIRVFSWDADVGWPIEPDEGGHVFSEIEVRFCRLDKKGEDFSPSELLGNFYLEYRGGRQFTPEGLGYQGDELISRNAVLQIGDCARGFIVFSTPSGQKPLLVVFESSSTHKWHVR